MLENLERIYPKPLKDLARHLQGLIKGRLWARILLAMTLGIGVGLFLGPSVGLVDPDIANVIGSWLALPGNIFLGLIQMIVVPLVFASVVTGLAASENMDQLRRVGISTVAFFLVTTVIAITIGLGAGLIIKPGHYVDTSSLEVVGQGGPGSGAETGRAPGEGEAPPEAQGAAGIVPGEAGTPTEAPTEASTETPTDASTEAPTDASTEAPTDAPTETPAETPALVDVPEIIAEILPQNPLGSMVEREMLQVVLFAAIFGMALISLAPEQSRPLLQLLNSIQEVSMTVVRWAMLLAPVAVFGLLAQTTIRTGLGALLGMIVYVGTVLLGLVLLLLFFLLLVFLGAGKSPRWFLQEIREVQLLAFSTSSSAAVMPMSIEVAEDRLMVKPSISQFVIPLGATINMTGTALYQGVATIFLSQVFGVELTVFSLLLIIVTTVGASIGSPATPGVGIVILSMVLTSVGIPPSGIALILGVDRILDMSRTTINVTGDLATTLIMNRWLGDT